MNKFYIDVEKAERRRLLRRLKIQCNGVVINRVIRAKSGKNGFVEFLPQHTRTKGYEFITKKVRGNVKISIRKDSL